MADLGRSGPRTRLAHGPEGSRGCRHSTAYSFFVTVPLRKVTSDIRCVKYPKGNNLLSSDKFPDSHRANQPSRARKSTRTTAVRLSSWSCRRQRAAGLPSPAAPPLLLILAGDVQPASDAGALDHGPEWRELCRVGQARVAQDHVLVHVVGDGQG